MDGTVSVSSTFSRFCPPHTQASLDGNSRKMRLPLYKYRPHFTGDVDGKREQMINNCPQHNHEENSELAGSAPGSVPWVSSIILRKSFTIKRVRPGKINSRDVSVSPEKFFSHVLADCEVRMILHDLYAELVLQRQILRFPESKDQIGCGKIPKDHLCDQCGTIDLDG